MGTTLKRLIGTMPDTTSPLAETRSSMSFLRVDMLDYKRARFGRRTAWVQRLSILFNMKPLTTLPLAKLETW